MNRTNIEWTDYTWNPIKGLCPNGCWYCYARRIYQRFNWEKNPYFFYPEVMRPYAINKSSKIFVCSTFELFHPITNTLLFPLTEGSDITYRDMIFKVIKENPQHTFQILTKFPQSVDRKMPDNVWLGVSVTRHDEINRIKTLVEIQAGIKFISIEPFLEPLCVSAENFLQNMDWIIIGRLTGYGKKYDPRRSSIKGIETFAKNRKIPIFLKNNLKEIWGEPLIQEFPKEEGK